MEERGINVSKCSGKAGLTGNGKREGDITTPLDQFPANARPPFVGNKATVYIHCLDKKKSRTAARALEIMKARE